MSTGLPGRFAVEVPVTINKNRLSRWTSDHLVQVADIRENDNWSFGAQTSIREFPGRPELYLPGLNTRSTATNLKTANEILPQGTKYRMSALGWDVSQLSTYNFKELEFPRYSTCVVSPGTDLPAQPTKSTQTRDGTQCCPWKIAKPEPSRNDTENTLSAATQTNNPANIGSMAIATITFIENDW
jgi:hypothetical protein